MDTNRRAVLAGMAASALVGTSRAQALPELVVTKDPSCGCCETYADYLRENGFEVEVKPTHDLPLMKRQYGVPGELEGCHTTLVAGYVVEGHVPASAIRRLLTEKPRATGIAVPGMPVGSPGMEMGARVDRYDVIAFAPGGATRVFARH